MHRFGASCYRRLPFTARLTAVVNYRYLQEREKVAMLDVRQKILCNSYLSLH